jgi:hypothetical protein
MPERELSVVPKIKQILQHTDFLAEPAVPELSFRPDFMASIENQLTFFEISSLGEKENVDWRTLRLIEYLFEVKLFFGNKSCFHLILLNPEKWKPYCLELLESFFDKITYGSNVARIGDLYTRPKTANFRLWDLEREFERSRPAVSDEESLNNFRYRDMMETELRNEIFRKLIHFNPSISQHHSVRNLKNYYLKREMNLRFYFDFYVNRKIVEVVSFKKLRNVTLQNLLIKSRLIRYQKIDDQINRIQAELDRMLLLVNGDISGPEYDRLRFLRMLTAAGWDVYPADIKLQRLGELV